ncbi:sodium:calcium antiporter [Roseomonas sp. AR75]|uniref:sodium:calcium antiporter n=1 Tax=Roseomonas sp. AR75 TaxID=2562311 RepID=UPI0010C081A4|nr:sodium:calcium antiporter [Roseomonas sp. AR75]
MLNFESWPLWLLAAVFAGAAAVVWVAGSRLAGYVDQISDRTGMGKGFAGLVLLGGITSLPEVAVSVTSSFTGEEVLAVNNLLGSVAAQVALLAMADAAIGREALTSVVVQPVVLLQAALNIILLALVAAAITTGDVAIGPFGLWSLVLLLGYLASIWALSGYEGRITWMVPPEQDSEQAATPAAPSGHDNEDERSTRALVLRTTAAAAAILVAGYLLSQAGSAAAARTGLGSAFFGATFVAVATSLPEISTMLGAVRLKRYEMALGDIFGTNLFNAALIFVTDALSSGAPVLGRVGAFSAFGALLGAVLTALFMAGLVERRDRTVLRMGWDSLAALICYAGGIAVLYLLRNQTGG